MYAIIGILSLTIAVQSVLHYIERKDLYDRLQSGSYSEYKTSKQPHRPRPPTNHERMLKKWRDMGGGDID